MAQIVCAPRAREGTACSSVACVGEVVPAGTASRCSWNRQAAALQQPCSGGSPARITTTWRGPRAATATARRRHHTAAARHVPALIASALPRTVPEFVESVESVVARALPGLATRRRRPVVPPCQAHNGRSAAASRAQFQLAPPLPLPVALRAAASPASDSARATPGARRLPRERVSGTAAQGPSGHPSGAGVPIGTRSHLGVPGWTLSWMVLG